jgi:aminoglycoside phosphotransferase (APT) family kinase protein
MITHGKPAAEVEIDERAVHALLLDQHPDLAQLPLRHVDSGWDNVMFRLGDELALRFPRRKIAAALIEHEQTWLPAVASSLPLPVPVPLRVGQCGRGYPWRWSVLPWLAGSTADQNRPQSDQAGIFGDFLAALHRPAPPDAPRNPYRGVPLRDRMDETMAGRINAVTTNTALLTPRIMEIWNDALAAPTDVQDTWIHGDPHPGNLLVHDGRITGVIDWGDLAAGDRATDLASIWMTFDTVAARRTAMNHCGPVSDATWIRAKGWAVFYGITFIASALANEPRYAALGERIFEHVTAGP